jgi:tetratricopeptide (TPR) repeat protein
MRKTALLLTAILTFSAMTLYAQTAQIHLENGKKLFDQKDYDGAIREFTEAIRLDPKNAKAYGDRGSAYFNKKDYDRAIADFTEYIRLDPKYATVYRVRGDVYSAKKDYNRAIADYTEYISRNSNSISLGMLIAYANRGNAYFNKKDYDRAIADYEAALSINPNDSDAKEGLALAKSAAANQNDSSQSATGVITITAKDLLSAYDSNQLRADAQYLNKTVKITGKVTRIGKDILGDNYIMLETSIMIYIKSSEINKAMTLDNGKTVTLIGTCKGKPGLIIDFKDAVFSN